MYGSEGPAQKPEITEQVFVRLLRAGDRIEGRVAGLLKEAGLSPPQYNVLRILRGAEPEGLTCGKIRERMINRVPDVTRLLDRLENSKLVERFRDGRDRRVVTQRITPEGLGRLAALDRPVRELHRRELGHLSGGELAELHRLLGRILDGEEGGGGENARTEPILLKRDLALPDGGEA